MYHGGLENADFKNNSWAYMLRERNFYCKWRKSACCYAAETDLKNCISLLSEPLAGNRRKTFLPPFVFVHCTQLWKWKNNRGSSKISSRKNNENNKFSVTTVANWMVNFYYMENPMKLFIFNASWRKHFSFYTQPSPLWRIFIFNSLWLKEEKKRFAFIMLMFHLIHPGARYTEWLCRFVYNSSQVNAIILRIFPRVKKW